MKPAKSTKSTQLPKSNFDISPNNTASQLTAMIGDFIQQKKKNRKYCCKCHSMALKKPYYITKLNAIYICQACKYQLISLIDRGTEASFGSRKNKPKYTDDLRTRLFNWFLGSQVRITRRISILQINKILKAIQFKIIIPKVLVGNRDIKIAAKIYAKGNMKLVPWKHDFKNNCVKCNKAYHLHKHHITYTPEITAFLCEQHHNQITALNTAAAKVAKTSLTYKPTYTNQIRVIIWRWFLVNSVKTKSEVILTPLIKQILYSSKVNMTKNKLDANLLKLKETCRGDGPDKHSVLSSTLAQACLNSAI